MTRYEPPQMDTNDLTGLWVSYDAGLVKRGPAQVGVWAGIDDEGEIIWNYWTQLPPDYFDAA